MDPDTVPNSWKSVLLVDRLAACAAGTLVRPQEASGC
jgi:hypothetical protein